MLNIAKFELQPNTTAPPTRIAMEMKVLNVHKDSSEGTKVTPHPPDPVVAESISGAVEPSSQRLKT